MKAMDEWQARQQYRYELNRSRIAEEYLGILDTAIEKRYLSMQDQGIPNKQVPALVWAYQAYCAVHHRPYVVIAPGKREHFSSVMLKAADGTILNLQDDTFKQLVQSTKYYAADKTYISFWHVENDKADEVAMQLLAFYDGVAARSARFGHDERG